MSVRARLVAACLTLTAPLWGACGPQEAELTLAGDETAEVEGALCSSADVAGLAEGSAQARGVLRAANELSEVALRTQAKLSTLAARNIAKTRAGADGVAGTADDQTFGTLKELSAVCQVGNVAMRALLAYAEANGLVAEDLPYAPCLGELSPLEYQAAYGRSPWLTVRADRWQRSCQESGGVKTCQPWARGPIDDAPSVYGSGLARAPEFEVRVDGSGGVASIVLANPQTSSYWGKAAVGATAGGVTGVEVTLSYRGYTNVCDSYSWGGGAGSGGCLRSHYDYFNATWLTMRGSVAEACLRVSDEVKRASEVAFGPGVSSYVETVRTLMTVP